jgi:hypothetical protein
MPLERLLLQVAPGERVLGLGPGDLVVRGTDASGARWRARVLPGGQLVREGPAGELLDRVEGLPGEFLWLEGGADGSRLRRAGAGPGDETWIARSPLITLAARAGEVLAGGRGGELVRFGSRGAVRGLRRVSGTVRALAATSSGWAVLLGSSPPRLLVLAGDLSALRERVLCGEVEGLVSCPRARVLWVFGPEGAWALDEAGRDRAHFETEPGQPVRGALALADGGVLLMCPGALIELEAGGRARRTQGGFDDLVDLVRAPSSRPARATSRPPAASWRPGPPGPPPPADASPPPAPRPRPASSGRG